MGYSTILDIVGSVIMGGVLMVILLSTNSNAVQNTYTYGGDVSLQQGLTSVTQIIDSDFRKIGYSSILTVVLDPTKIILLADTSSIKFLSDVNNSGSIDTVYYYLSAATELSYSTNPRDRNLYRMTHDAVSSAVTMRCPGVTIFRFAYFDSLGNALSCPVSTLAKIAKIQISLKMESASPYNGTYVSTAWNSTKRISVNVLDR
jgi:hypothetical protein